MQIFQKKLFRHAVPSIADNDFLLKPDITINVTIIVITEIIIVNNKGFLPLIEHGPGPLRRERGLAHALDPVADRLDRFEGLAPRDLVHAHSLPSSRYATASPSPAPSE